MTGFVAKRLLSAVLTLFLVSMGTFGLAFMAGDPAISVAGKNATAEQIEAVRKSQGFDRPVLVQYAGWLTHAMHGDLGRSYQYKREVAPLVMSRLPVTLGLGLSAIILALLVSLPLGMAGAARPGGVADKILSCVSVFCQAMPSFWLALLMVVFIGLKLRWLPISGTGTPAHFVMPALVLAAFALPPILKLTRTGVEEALASDYVRTARAKGLKRGRIMIQHVLKNAMLPLVSISAVQLGMLLSGSIVVEQIFALHGIGWLSYDATIRSDLPVIQAITLVIACFYIFLTLAADLLNAWLDPRLREQW